MIFAIVGKWWKKKNIYVYRTLNLKMTWKTLTKICKFSRSKAIDRSTRQKMKVSGYFFFSHFLEQISGVNFLLRITCLRANVCIARHTKYEIALCIIIVSSLVLQSVRLFRQDLLPFASSMWLRSCIDILSQVYLLVFHSMADRDNGS